ncbi:MerR family transcriptional regulator [Paenibacillus sp. J2TS4]|uniref:MerR family transcriptional regulator n=1 Tax=Paenibacillus sp. J2TS4 TaxID=2807194 RepID=UPI001B19FF34|nr:MerR family transcriptional regulator [Paenibacillus sp. J2TS4]GIP35088.1 MerR family transcriptional regulator [Paenibacillus sp. J2TS4]
MPLIQWFTIGEFAKLTGVTERTLRFYDKKSLLKPSGYNEQGHRLYSNKDIVQLQKILTLKYLDYPLEEIAEHLQKPEPDLQSSLAFQYELLLQKREHLDQVIATLGRVQNILHETENVETDYLLMAIYMLQHEEKQKEWLLQRFSKPTVDALFMEGRPEERLEFERKTIALISELKKLGKEGKSADDPVVQEKGTELLNVMISAVEAGALEELVQQIDVEQLADELVLFPDFFQEDEAFLKQVFENMDESLINRLFQSKGSSAEQEERPNE